MAIEPLARELGVTKGSAYWHFKDRNDLLKAALHRWGRDTEAGGERLLAEIPNPRARHRVGLGLITKDPKKRRIEAAILAAAHDPVVRPYLKKVRAARLDSWSSISASSPATSGSGNSSSTSRPSRIASADKSARVTESPAEAEYPSVNTR